MYVHMCKGSVCKEILKSHSFQVGMGDIENLYTIIVKQEYHDYHDYCFYCTFAEN